MKSSRFYLVILFALVTCYSAVKVFTDYPLFRDKGMSEEALEDTKYFHSDCGKVVLADRTESHQNSSQSRYEIDYYVTYYSPYRGENHTLNVTPGAYASAKHCKDSGSRICFTVADGSYASDSMSYSFFYFLLVVGGAFFLGQTYFWVKEEFDI